jgi:hypothetical protein
VKIGLLNLGHVSSYSFTVDKKHLQTRPLGSKQTNYLTILSPLGSIRSSREIHSKNDVELIGCQLKRSA